MKKIIVVSVLSALALVGCSSQSPSPVVTVTKENVVPAPSVNDGVAQSNTSLYLSALRSLGNPILNSASDAELLDVGHTVCEILSKGYSSEEIIYYMANEMAKDGNTSDAYAEAVGSIIGAAEVALCPGESA